MRDGRRSSLTYRDRGKKKKKKKKKKKINPSSKVSTSNAKVLNNQKN